MFKGYDKYKKASQNSYDTVSINTLSEETCIMKSIITLSTSLPILNDDRENDVSSTRGRVSLGGTPNKLTGGVGTHIANNIV